MKIHRLFAVILCAVLCGQIVRAQDMDAAITKLTEDVAAKIKENGNKKVTVLDFTDLEGSSSELGKYIAEQLTVDFVMTKRDFAVLDRANRKRILEELKLNVSGLVNPENAKKLGSFSGVDALIFGTITPVGTNINVTVKIITTDTSEVVGGAKAKFQTDDTVQKLTSKPATDAGDAGADEAKPKPAIVKTLGDLRVDLESLRMVNNHEYLLTLTLTNLNAKKSIWVAVRMNNSTMLTGNLTDADGAQYTGSAADVTGIAADSLQYDGFFKPSEIKVGESFPCTVKLRSYAGRPPTAGQCILQLDFLLGYNFSGNFGSAVSKSLQAKMETDK
jgi:curli biogenesis system outer membrane secretion channel CsgG